MTLPKFSLPFETEASRDVAAAVRFCPPDHLSRAAGAGLDACPGCGWALDRERAIGIGDRIELRPSGRPGEVRGEDGSMFLVSWDDGFGPTRVAKTIVAREGEKKPWEEIDSGAERIVSTTRPRNFPSRRRP